jgi:hypothetical protein
MPSDIQNISKKSTPKKAPAFSGAFPEKNPTGRLRPVEFYKFGC